MIAGLEVYKKGQGNRARSLAALAAGLIVVFGVSEAFRSMQPPASYVMGCVIIVVLGGGGIYFPFFHRKTVDFLVDTQAEMKKVAWASWAEVRGSTGVVITSVIILAVFLYVTDSVLALVTQLVGILPKA